MKISKEEKPINLLRWFSILSFFSIVLITTVSSLVLSRFLTDNILQRDAAVTKEFVQSIVESQKASIYFEETNDGMARKAFEDLFKRIATMPEVMRANVYDNKGTVLWSDDERLIKHNFMPNPELINALSGNLAISSGTSGKPIKGEHVFDVEVPFFAEIYIPIWNTNKERVVGVFEVYKVPLILFEAIQKGNQLVWVTAGLGGLFLYASLYWIVKRATAVMKKQQDRLIESETLVVVGEMASAIAHGIRNPLASIRSSAELALLEDEDSPFRDTAEDIISEADRLAGWIKELLSYARLSNGELSSVQLNEVIRSTFDSYRKEMKKHDIKINLDLEEPIPEIKADEAPLRQMFLSLVANAIEAMPEGGEFTARSRFVKNTGLVETNLIDNGCGIRKDQLAKVFKPFFTTKRKGVGVGLSLAKRIISRHQGTIRIKSSEGHGTTISLQIPIPER